MLWVFKKVCILDIERYRNAPPSFHGQDSIDFIIIYTPGQSIGMEALRLTGFFY